MHNEVHIQRTRRVRLGAALLAFTLVGAACSSGSDGGSGDGSSGAIVISGSSTVEPISASNGKKFAQANSGVSVDVSGPGTGDGFERFCAGETDVSNASRAIKQEEHDDCADNSIRYIELQVGVDGITVVTQSGTPIECLSYEQMYALAGPESIGVGSWSDANELATELGGSGDLPDISFNMSAPGEESGTYDFFVEEVFEGIWEERVSEGAIDADSTPLGARPDYQASPNDNVIADFVRNTEGSFGWFGFAFFAGNPELQPIAVDGGDGCVEPTLDTIADGSYPVARPLFIYVNIDKLETKPELAAYLDFYMSEDGLATVEEVDYVRLPADDEAAEQKRYADRTEGSRFLS